MSTSLKLFLYASSLFFFQDTAFPKLLFHSVSNEKINIQMSHAAEATGMLRTKCLKSQLSS